MRTIDVAISQLGVTEATGNNDGIPAVRYCQGEKLPWCSALLLYANDHADEDAKLCATKAQRYLLRSVTALERELMGRGWWFLPSMVPERNDLVFFGSRGTSDAGGGRHVGIIESVELKSRDLVTKAQLGTIHTVEGNVGNKCARMTHKLTDQRITGYARIPPRTP